MSAREWQNGFEAFNQSLSAITTFKDGVGGCHRLDYRDLGEAVGDREVRAR